jgi:tetratricopeptide (TPR) repeat protein
MYKPAKHGGGVDKAIPLLLKSVELDPAFHEGYYWLARAYMQNSFKKRDEGKAKAYLSKGLKLSPEDYFYRLGLTPDVQVPEYKEVGKKSSKKG